MHNQASEPFCTSLSNPETWHTVLAYGLCPIMSNGVQVLKARPFSHTQGLKSNSHCSGTHQNYI